MKRSKNKFLSVSHDTAGALAVFDQFFHQFEHQVIERRRSRKYVNDERKKVLCSIIRSVYVVRQ